MFRQGPSLDEMQYKNVKKSKRQRKSLHAINICSRKNVPQNLKDSDQLSFNLIGRFCRTVCKRYLIQALVGHQAYVQASSLK
jgi:hypothetical protein